MKMMINTISVILIILKTIKCSLVFDAMSQTGAYINKYCQETEYCVEGTHLMCRQYDQNQKMGPRCKDMFQTEYDKEDDVVSMFNDIRGRIASGRMLTLDGKPFPRAYGMMRLKVNPELTLFAKTMSHACFRRFQEENCANTDIFPSTAFVYSEIKQFAYEKNVTGAMNLLREHILAKTPAEWFTDVSPDVGDMRDEKFKVTLQGAVRYVGCAMRLMRTEYEPEKYYNGVLCYFANVNWPIHQKPYITERPSAEKGYTEECGCPMGYIETEDCLCDEQEQPLWLRAGHYPLRRPAPLSNLMPDKTTLEQICRDRIGYDDRELVLLPIFSIKNKRKYVKRNLRTDQIARLLAKNQHECDVLNDLRTYSNKHTAFEKSYPKVPSTLKNKHEKELQIKSVKANKIPQLSNDKKHVTRSATFERVATQSKTENHINIGLLNQEKQMDYHLNNINIKNIVEKTGFDNLMYFLHSLEKGARYEVKKNEREMFLTKTTKSHSTLFHKQKEMPYIEIHTTPQLFDIDNEFTELKNYLKLRSNLSLL